MDFLNENMNETGELSTKYHDGSQSDKSLSFLENDKKYNDQDLSYFRKKMFSVLGKFLKGTPRNLKLATILTYGNNPFNKIKNI